MPTSGKLLKVWDNESKSGKISWGLVIDVDDHGEHRLTLWDKKYAGIDTESSKAVADVHDWEGQRIVYTARKGGLKDKSDPDGERWPATIEDIALEEGGPEKPITEMVKEELARESESEGPKIEPASKPVEIPGKDKDGDLARLTMNLINALGEWAHEIGRRTE